MRTWTVTALLGLASLVGACASPDKEWMKVGQRYTTEEFRRDHAACSRGGRLDDACMRSRGWVDVTAGKYDKTTIDQDYKRPFGQPPGAYR